MKNVAIPIAALVAVLLIVTILRTRQGLLIASKQSSHPAPSETYVGLRNLILRSSREKLNLSATSRPPEPWGVVMDLDVSRGTATVTYLSDGNASIYVSSGGGYLGGVGKPAINEAAKNFVRHCCGIPAGHEGHNRISTSGAGPG